VTTSVTDTRSSELYRRALNVLPGGVNSPVRAMRAIGRDPIFVERGVGAEITDVDGNIYVDYVCSWGPLIHGHAHPDVIAAITESAAGGTTYGAPTLQTRATRLVRSSGNGAGRSRNWGMGSCVTIHAINACINCNRFVCHCPGRGI